MNRNTCASPFRDWGVPMSNRGWRVHDSLAPLRHLACLATVASSLFLVVAARLRTSRSPSLTIPGPPGPARCPSLCRQAQATVRISSLLCSAFRRIRTHLGLMDGRRFRASLASMERRASQTDRGLRVNWRSSTRSPMERKPALRSAGEARDERQAPYYGSRTSTRMPPLASCVSNEAHRPHRRQRGSTRERAPG